MGDIKVSNPEINKQIIEKIVEKEVSVEKLVYQTRLRDVKHYVDKPVEVPDQTTEKYLIISAITNVILFVCSSVLLYCLLFYPSC
jgi:predicted metal-dependent RNase